MFYYLYNKLPGTKTQKAIITAIAIIAALTVLLTIIFPWVELHLLPESTVN